MNDQAADLRRIHRDINEARVKLDESLKQLMYEIEATLAWIDDHV